MAVDFERVPVDARRRAARALATLSADHAPGMHGRAAGLRFGRATEVFRPDVRGVAYWEIEIEGVRTVLPAKEGDPGKDDRGFVVVSTGPHDVPIPHFSLDLAPPSRQLAQLGKVARVVKLDALCYAGEDDSGELVGSIGTVPPKLTGMPAELPARLPGGWATTTGKAQDRDDQEAAPLRLRASREKRPVALTGWRSWRELTKGYAEAYRLHLDALARRAAPRWEIERLTEEFGEGIRSGVTHRLLLLADGEFSIGGPPAGHVTAELNPQPLPPGPPELLLTPRADVTDRDTSFTVHLKYRTGETEELRFFIVPDQAPTTVTPANTCLGTE